MALSHGDAGDQDLHLILRVFYLMTLNCTQLYSNKQYNLMMFVSCGIFE